MRQTLTILILLLSSLTFAQNSKEKLSLTYFAQAKSQMASEQYEEANITFRKIIRLQATLPPDFSFYFAQTLYQIEQYENAANFIKKFIELNTLSHPLYEEAIHLQTLLNVSHETIKSCQQCNNQGYVKDSCLTCLEKGRVLTTCKACEGQGIRPCEECSGQGVTITYGFFNDKQYETCKSCKGQGQEQCTICDGKLNVYEKCPTCRGKGFTVSNELCSHGETEIITSDSSINVSILPEPLVQDTLE